MHISFGCDAFSGYRIEGDDKLIQKKGVEWLSEAEVCKYCRERGIYAGEEMRQQVFVQIL